MRKSRGRLRIHVGVFSVNALSWSAFLWCKGSFVYFNYLAPCEQIERKGGGKRDKGGGREMGGDSKGKRKREGGRKKRGRGRERESEKETGGGEK